MAASTPAALAASHAQHALAIVDGDERVVWVNRAFEQLTGRDAADALHQPLSLALGVIGGDPETPAPMRLAPGSLVEGDLGGSQASPLLARKPCAARYWLNLAFEPLPAAQEPAGGFAVTLTDVTGKRADAEDIHRLRHMLDELESVALMGCWELDPHDERMIWSTGAGRIADGQDGARRVSVDAALRRFPDDARQAIIEALERLRNDNTPFQLETALESDDGCELWVSMSGRMVRSHDRDKYFGVIQDITHHRDYERDVAQAREDAARADHAKAAFLANMSHELRTPLNGVMGMLQALLQRDLSGESRELAAIAYESAGSLLATLKDVIDMAKLETGQYQIRRGWFDPGVVARDVWGLFASQARQKGLLLEIDIDPRTPRRVYGDGGRVRQVLTNLLSNAVKFTPRGVVRVLLGLVDDQLRFEVTDTGVGIPKDRQSLLFKPFTVADDSHSREHQGAGLGLAISKILVERMGGSIHFASLEGSGSRFWFDIDPYARPDDDAEDVDAPNPRDRLEPAPLSDDQRRHSA